MINAKNEDACSNAQNDADAYPAPGEETPYDSCNEETNEIPVTQIELAEKDPVDLSVLDSLAKAPYQVFVLSQYGRPIYVSSGEEEKLCAIFALIGVFVNRVRHMQDDVLHSVSSGYLHAHFLLHKPLILCIVSKKRDQLVAQLNVLYEQILSTISKTQLDTVYEQRGDNYDLRRLLGGTAKYMDACLSNWHSDISQICSTFRVFPLQASDRDFLGNAIVSAVKAGKSRKLLFAIILANRQVVSIARSQRQSIHARDLHILINLVANNDTITDCALWTPICLPTFNSSGFLHTFISTLWERSSAYILLLSIDRDDFNNLLEVQRNITDKIKANPKVMSALECAFASPTLFSIPQNIGSGHESLWYFIYKNYTSMQHCQPAIRPPYISKKEFGLLTKNASTVCDMLRSVPGITQMFVKRGNDVLYIVVKGNYELQLVLAPFTTPHIATSMQTRLLKALNTHEQRHFLINKPSF